MMKKCEHEHLFLDPEVSGYNRSLCRRINDALTAATGEHWNSNTVQCAIRLLAGVSIKGNNGAPEIAHKFIDDVAKAWDTLRD
jgi:hypothetical protein